MTRSDFEYTIKDDVIEIIDLNFGRMSVTNDIENVLAHIVLAESEKIGAEFLLKTFKIIYCDSEGVYDGIEIKDNKFFKFIPIQKKIKQEAILSMNSKNENKWHETELLLYCRYQFDVYPEILHIIKSGFNDLYYCFYENAYETEPQSTGMMYLTRDEIKKRFKIDVKK